MFLKKVFFLLILVLSLNSCKKDPRKIIIGQWVGVEEIQLYSEGVLEFENTTPLNLEISRNGSGKLTIHNLNQAPFSWSYSELSDIVVIDINDHRQYEGTFIIFESTKEVQVWESDKSLTYYDLERGEITSRSVRKWTLEASE